MINSELIDWLNTQKLPLIQYQSNGQKQEIISFFHSFELSYIEHNQWLELEPVDLIDVAQIYNLLKSKLYFLSELNYHYQFICHSTNDEIKIKTDSECILLSDFQIRGRGRLGRQWQSEPFKNMILSLKIAQDKFNSIEALSLVVGLALIQSLNKNLSLKKQNLCLKWPNDLISIQPYNQKYQKLSGILIESEWQKESNNRFVIIGVGMNVEKQNNPYSHTSIEELVLQNLNIKRNELIANFIKELDSLLITFAKQGFAPFRQEWLDYSCKFPTEVEILLPNGSKHFGLYQGVDKKGKLLIEYSNGQCQSYANAEIQKLRF